MKPDTEKTTFAVLLEKDKKIPPRVIFSKTALRWIRAMVDVHPLEVGFYGIVDERENYTFFVRDIFYPKHSEANGATCEISPEGETDMMEWLCDHDKEDDVPKVRLWGHSHHNMGTGPSGQDEKQAIERMEATQSFLIRVICNKKGEMSLSFFDYENRIRFDHVKWEVEDDCDDIDNEAKLDDIALVVTDNSKTPTEKVKEINSITVRDNQSSNIKDKVKELKEINIPKATTITQPPYPGSFYDKRGRGFYQPSLFKNKNGKDVFFPSANEELEQGFQNNIYKEDDFDKAPIDKMIQNWEDNIGIEGY